MSLTDAEILTEIYNNCDPIVPASALFYEDCTDVRGGDAFARDLCKEISSSRGRVYQLFAGHIGGGKSSELKHLAARMNVPVPSTGQKRFFPIIVNTLKYVEENNGAIEYILLGIVEEVSQVLREAPIADLTPKPLPSFIESLRTILTTPLQLTEVKATGGPLETTFTSLRNSPTARENVMKAVRGNETRLREAVNDFLQTARTAIQNAPVPDGENKYTDFVLILDGMDRILQIEGKNAGTESQRALFIDGFDALINLNASAVYTAHLSLVRSEGNILSSLYTRDPYVLPMVKTEKHGSDHPPYEPGRERLTRLLQRRMPPGVALAYVMADDALN